MKRGPNKYGTSKSYLELLGFASILVLTILFAGCVDEQGNSDKDISHSLHKNTTVTVFWIGEEGNEENGFIPNLQSAWDDDWAEDYGGVDDPDNRNGYLPTNFTPFENPFYFALPYNDFDENGERRSDAYEVIPWSKERAWNDSESMCKNRWIRITNGEKCAYAQWEDVGPFGEDDAAYVFGSAAPKNEVNDNAGLDVSPAVRDLLGISDIDKVDWQFVDSTEVPDGPWKDIVTTSQIDWK